MRSLLFSIVLLFTITSLFKSHLCQNQDGDKKIFLDGHNAARHEVGVEPYAWDSKLQAYAQDFANKAKSDCETGKGSKGPYYLNQALGYEALSSWQAMNGWTNEKDDYNYTSNSCAKGKNCSGYTQVVWRKSVRLGCGSVVCGAGWPLYVCVYDPPGNIPGEKPY